jgi:hypothetical protein
MSDSDRQDTLNRGYSNLKHEAARAKQKGLLTYSKEYGGKRARNVGLSGAIMLNSMFVALGVVLIVFGSSMFYTAAGGVSSLLGIVGLINNVRYAL